jgi:hypothetical protein
VKQNIELNGSGGGRTLFDVCHESKNWNQQQIRGKLKKLTNSGKIRVGIYESGVRGVQRKFENLSCSNSKLKHIMFSADK